MSTRLVDVLLTAFFVLTISACSSSDSSSTTAGTGALDASSASNVNSTFNALEGLLEGIEADDASAKLSPRAAQGDPGMGDGKPSRLGCHYKMDVKRMFREVERIKGPLCAMDLLEASGVGFVIPTDGSYAYYKLIDPPGGPDEPGKEHFFLRVRSQVGADGLRSLDYQMCDGSTQSEDFLVSELSGGIEASSVHKFSGTDPDGNEINGEGSLLLSAFGSDAETLTSAVIETEFTDEFGCGSLTLSADRTVPRNSLLGYFVGGFEGFSFSHGVCVHAARGKGSGKVAGTGTFPPFINPETQAEECPNPSDPMGGPISPNADGVCEDTFDHSENFRFALDPSGKEICVIDGNPNQDLLALVDSCQIPTACTTPADFTRAWDCTAPNGFTEIDLLSVPAIEECFHDDFFDDFEDCDREAHNEEGGQNQQPPQ